MSLVCSKGPVRRPEEAARSETGRRPLTVPVDAACGGLEETRHFESRVPRHSGPMRSRRAARLTEDAALAEGTRVMQQQPGVHAVSVVLVETRQHPQTLRRQHGTRQHMLQHARVVDCSLYNLKCVFSDLVVVERLQADCTVVRLHRLGRVAPRFGLAVPFGLEGQHSLQDVLFRKQLRNATLYQRLSPQCAAKGRRR